jgi:hypothetical protein
MAELLPRKLSQPELAGPYRAQRSNRRHEDDFSGGAVKWRSGVEGAVSDGDLHTWSAAVRGPSNFDDQVVRASAGTSTLRSRDREQKNASTTQTAAVRSIQHIGALPLGCKYIN